jgi:hypothetical protein
MDKLKISVFRSMYVLVEKVFHREINRFLGCGLCKEYAHPNNKHNNATEL